MAKTNKNARQPTPDSLSKALIHKFLDKYGLKGLGLIHNALNEWERENQNRLNAEDNEVIEVRTVHHGRSGAGTYNGIKKSKSKEALVKWGEQLKKQYHPAGYGTDVSEPKKGKNADSEYWYIKWSRAGSCD